MENDDGEVVSVSLWVEKGAGSSANQSLKVKIKPSISLEILNQLDGEWQPRGTAELSKSND